MDPFAKVSSPSSKLFPVFCIAVTCVWGCNNEHGVQPPKGYDTTKVDYRPQLTDDTEILELPVVDPRRIPETLPFHAFHASLPARKKMAFVGVIVPYDRGTKGTIIRIDLRRRVTPDQFDNQSSYSGVALKEESGQLGFRITGQAPIESGDYEFKLLSIGPSASLTELDAFLVGEIHVQ